VADIGKKKCFLIMPFQTKLDWLRRIVVSAGEDVDVVVERSDDIFAPDSILTQILRSIDEADVVVCVCTGRNANVFFELGYAWRKHRVVLVAEEASDLPSDFSHYRTIIYGEPTPDLDQAKLRKDITRYIQAVLDSGPMPMPEGTRLAAAPTPKRSARVSGRYLKGGSGSARLALANAGTVDLYGVDVELPEAVDWLHVHRDDLPIEVLRPGEQVDVLMMSHMGGGPRIFDATVTAVRSDGEPFSQPVKISS
jgi:hypothetical protein